MAAERTRGITGLIYETVRGVTRLVGGSTENLFAWLAPALVRADTHYPPSPEHEAILAALNGVLGDHLAETDNPQASKSEVFMNSARLRALVMGLPVPTGPHFDEILVISFLR